MLFRNMARKYFSALDPNAPNPGGPAPTSNPAPAPTPNPAPTIDPAELEAFKKWQAEQRAPTPNPNPAPEDMSARLARQERERLAAQADETKRRDEIKFDMGFDAFMAENGHLFGGFDFKNSREEHNKMPEHGKMVASLQVVSAKKFFAVPANLELLIGADRAYAAGMANMGDSSIDSAKAWELVERAIHVAKKSDYDRQVREASGKGPGEGDKTAIQTYVERCQNVGKARAAKSVQ